MFDRKCIAIGLLTFVSIGAQAASPASGAIPTLGREVRGAVAVEYVHKYARREYVGRDPVSLSASVAGDSPEVELIRFFKEMKSGNVEASMGYWDKRSVPLIKKLYGSMTEKEVEEAVRASNNQDWVVFLHRIDYEGYVIIRTARGKGAVPPASKLYTADFALVKRDGRWKLTQELADDPVYCCRDTPGGRLSKVGRPTEGEVQKVLDALNR